MYTHTNYKTKKALKFAVENGERVTVFQPNDMFNNPKAKPDYTGPANVEGPHFPEPHRWYAQVQITSGAITKVK